MDSATRETSASWIDDVRFASASPEDQRSGLVGFLSFRLGPLRIDGVALRKTSAGRTTLSFPARTDRAGERHHFLRPIDNEARREIEGQVLTALGIL